MKVIFFLLIIVLTATLLSAQQVTRHVFSPKDSARFVQTFSSQLAVGKEKGLAVFQVMRHYQERRLELMTGKHMSVDELHRQLALATLEKQKALNSLLNTGQREKLTELLRQQTQPPAFAELKKRRKEERNKRLR
jgi:hypothetical protein